MVGHNLEMQKSKVRSVRRLPVPQYLFIKKMIERRNLSVKIINHAFETLLLLKVMLSSCFFFLLQSFLMDFSMSSSAQNMCVMGSYRITENTVSRFAMASNCNTYVSRRKRQFLQENLQFRAKTFQISWPMQ